MKTCGYIVVFLLLLISVKCGRKGTGIMDKVTYSVIKQLSEGTYKAPVKERTSLEKRAYMRWYRNKDSFKVINGVLYYRDRKVLTHEEAKTVVDKEYRKTKGSGARKLFHRLNARYAGLTERHIQKLLNKHPTNKRIRIRFTNKPPMKPIRAKEPQERNQIDLMDMRGHTVETEDGLYRYILSILDIFSRFVWLIPLMSKKSKVIASSLKTIYDVFGPPRIIQCDQGGEFKGALNRLCKMMNIKLLRSRPYHPQAQGKVERSHRSLRDKIFYDMSVLSSTSVDWVKRLPTYANLLNNDPKRVLGYNTPFQVLFGRNNNSVTDKGENGECVVLDIEEIAQAGPDGKDLETFSTARESLRKSSSRATEAEHTYAIKRQQKTNPTCLLKVGQKVYIRLPQKKGVKRLVTSRRLVVKGTVTAQDKHCRYKVRYVCPHSQTEVTECFQESDITPMKRKLDKKKHKAKYWIPLSTEDGLDNFHSYGLEVRMNPPGDGNCMFSSISDQLQTLGVHRSPDSLRSEVVSSMRKEPTDAEGVHLANYTEFEWDHYLSNMAKTGTYGDHLVLTVVSRIFGVEVRIVDVNGTVTQVLPKEILPGQIPVIYLGYFPENEGEHYMSLRPTDPENESCPEERDSERESCPEEWNSERESCPEERNSVRESCSGVWNSDRESFPDKRNSDSESCPEDRDSDRESCPEARNSETESCSEERHGDRECCPENRESDRESCPEARDSETESCPEARDSETESCSEARDSETESCPEERDSETESCSEERDSDVIAAPFLPDLVIEKIITAYLSSARLTSATEFFNAYRTIKSVNRRFSQIATSVDIKRPKIYCPLQKIPGTISVRRLILLYGKGSGLAIEIRKLVGDKNWINAWLKVEYLAFGWYTVKDIAWRRK